MIIRKFDWDMIEKVYERKPVIIGVLEDWANASSFVTDDIIKERKLNNIQEYSEFVTPVIVVDDEVFPGYIEEVKDNNFLTKLKNIFRR